ncbi:MAG: hypothetical protein KDJ75_00050 [Alphaproteobacteria bacterium]|nr:hypothetical protein [Alphaproteobacteria bacterium]
MKHLFALIVTLALLSGGAVSPAFAEESTQTDASAGEAVVAPKKAINLVEFQKGLSPRDKQHFNILYANYNIAGVVKMVRADVANAIEQCSANNPDMADALNERYKKWDGAIDPVMAEADAMINNMLFAQDYADPKDIREVFQLIDDNRTQYQSEIKKVPVTTPEACEYLRNKMDETQETMTGLLEKTLVGLPQAMQALDEEPPEGAVNDDTGEGDAQKSAPADQEL